MERKTPLTPKLCLLAEKWYDCKCLRIVFPIGIGGKKKIHENKKYA